MALIDKFKEEVNFIPHLNTGVTIFDLATGKFVPGMNNKWILNGGLHCTSVTGGRVQTYKSTTAGSFLAGILNIYKGSEAFVYETEFNVPGPERYDEFVPMWEEPVANRISFHNGSQYTFDEFFDKKITEICKEKEKNKADYQVESPFININTLKPYKIWVPTIILTDSWSMGAINSVNEKYEESKSVDSSEMNTIFLKEGMVKTRVNRAIPNLAAKYGIYFICTAHIDEHISLNAREHPSKELQYMKQGQRFKNVGGCFEFLTSTLLQTINATALIDSTKTGNQYPSINGSGPINEVNEVNSMVVKCKNNAAGLSLPLIISQYQGILNEVTNFHYLRKFGDYGLMEKKSRSPHLQIYPKTQISRTTIRKIMGEDYALRRSLELTTQLCFIQNHWFTAKLPESINIPITKFAEKLNSLDKPLIDGILNSTGQWTFDKGGREYMSVFDIARLLSEDKITPVKGKK